MGLILDWSKQQWLSMDAYKKSAVNFGRTFIFLSKTLRIENNPIFTVSTYIESYS